MKFYKSLTPEEKTLVNDIFIAFKSYPSVRDKRNPVQLTDFDLVETLFLRLNQVSSDYHTKLKQLLMSRLILS